MKKRVSHFNTSVRGVKCSTLIHSSEIYLKGKNLRSGVGNMNYPTYTI
uniref:Uncharacterized protein n=1 Tax=Cruciviridae sp. TaxID=1955495 RepID=A0A1S6LVN2_9VIRU|nr:hypothetical protein [Cruciviridae sp.]